MADDLKPCPFCGGDAERIEFIGGENEGRDVISCTQCQASSRVGFYNEENLVSAWNTRPAPTLAEALDVPEVKATVEAGKALEKAATGVERRGATVGPQWTHLTIALLQARTALARIKGEAKG